MKTEGGGAVVKFFNEVDTSDVESICLVIASKLESLANTCENRNEMAFPADTVKDTIELCSKLKERTPHHKIPTKYIQHIRDNKESSSYFNASQDALKNEEDRIITKRKMFATFRSMIKDMDAL
ncbi:hypothetical protein CWI42_012020 [Ordospora colligata]|uniref:Mediator of RNA polymerase II transcription subunit 10 n=1 Tax=Ordospora colligata OC4 TaxID=1354746 RepID=A0A0B2UHI7_9MICR|nr:uncharacterized protein M896_012020 [Ordospora colligata OC4]KHN70546.1 hypothetical protein M896_012020 [Ordospora colligata OC4]TBU17296.1 hypothetical protein CWI41_012020 [Ordospora colligata]TBU17546.1 hypothetical protein CWI40_012020 [Ordospora colligata]TBU19726.1 hypothetical protein CWI42_012020 [Ordospora colligata]